jgi:HAD superfamily hydrolase (TIGR01509 family)
MSLQAVIFDMDGVLVDSERFICEAAIRMFADVHGIRAAPEDFVPFVGAGEDRYLGGVADKHGVRLTMPRDKDLTYAIYLELIRGRLQPLPGVREFTAAARRRGWKLAVATSADRVKMDGNLREIGLPSDTFDACICGDTIARKKPAPDIFLAAASALGLPPPSCLVVEDAVNGVVAARAAGSMCLALTTSFTAAPLRAAGAHWIAPTLAGAVESMDDFGRASKTYKGWKIRSFSI